MDRLAGTRTGSLNEHALHDGFVVMTGSPDLDGQNALQALFPGDDEAAALARATEWARTSLGDPADWGPELCSAVRTVMPSDQTGAGGGASITICMRLKRRTLW